MKKLIITLLFGLSTLIGFTQEHKEISEAQDGDILVLKRSALYEDPADSVYAYKLPKGEYLVCETEMFEGSLYSFVIKSLDGKIVRKIIFDFLYTDSDKFAYLK